MTFSITQGVKRHFIGPVMFEVIEHGKVIGCISMMTRNPLVVRGSATCLFRKVK